jgi:hypothetical protein
MWIAMMGRKGCVGSKGSASLPTKMAVLARLFLCRGSRSATAPPGCLVLLQRDDAQRVHDEESAIRTCDSEGKSCVWVSKGSMRCAGSKYAKE